MGFFLDILEELLTDLCLLHIFPRLLRLVSSSYFCLEHVLSTPLFRSLLYLFMHNVTKINKL